MSPQHTVSLGPLILDHCQPGRALLVGDPGGEPLWGTRIASAGPEQIIVFAPEEDRSHPTRHPGALLVADLPAGHALYRIPCQILDRLAGPTPLWVLGGFEEVRRIQRRRVPRFRGAFAAEVIPLGANGEGRPLSFIVPPSNSRNISSNGCYLQGHPALPIGSPVTIQLHLDPAEGPLRVQGEVVRHDRTSSGVTGHGIAFRDLAPAEAQAISRYISRQERRATEVALLG